MLRWAQGSDEGEIQGQSVISMNETTRQRVSVHVRAFVIEQEATADSPATMAGVISKVRQFPDVSLLGELASVRFDIQYIEPLDLPFHEINARVKAAFLASNDVVSAAADVQVVLDEPVDEKTTNHHQIGPMAPAQLNRQMLAFRRDSLPDQFVFVGLGRTVSQPGEFSIDWVTEAAEQFARFADERVAAVISLVRG